MPAAAAAGRALLLALAVQVAAARVACKAAPRTALLGRQTLAAAVAARVLIRGLVTVMRQALAALVALVLS